MLRFLSVYMWFDMWEQNLEELGFGTMINMENLLFSFEQEAAS